MAQTPNHLIVCGPFNSWDLDTMQREFTVHRIDDITAPFDLPAEAHKGAELATLMGHTPMGAAFFDRFSALKVVANFGVGYDAIDVEEASRRGITVTNTPDVLNADVADLAVLMLLSICRQSHAAENWLRDGNWVRQGAFPLQRKMSGGRAGILGLGRIGRAIADRLAAFEMEISYYARAPKDVPSDWMYHDTPRGLAAAVDFLIIAVTGGAGTANIVSADVIEALGPEGILVNISRGTTVDEEALIAALQNSRIAGAALDVFLNEPDIDPRFLGLDNVLLQPHVASATLETRKAMGQLVIDNLIAARDGKPLLTPVN